MTMALAQARMWMVAHLVSIPMLTVAPVSAQEVATSFEQLRGLVKPGHTVYITDANGRKTKGKLGELSSSSLELLIRKTGPDGRDAFVAQTRQSESDVREIQIERSDSLWNGTLIGLGVGASPMLVVCIANRSCDYNEAGGEQLFLVGALMMGGIGAGVGALIDLSIKERRTIYRAPGSRSSGVRISPLLSKSAAGVEMSIRF